MFSVDPGLSVILASIIAILGYWIQAYFSRKMEVEKETRREKTKRFTIIISELPYVFFPAYKEKLTKT